MSTSRVDRRRQRLERLSVLQASREVTGAYRVGSAGAWVDDADAS